MSTERKDDMLKSEKGVEKKVQADAKSAKSKGHKPRAASSDAYIRTLFAIAGIVVIGALLTVIFAYMSGVISFDQNRATTMQEFTVVRAQAYADSSPNSLALSQLAIAQIDSGLFVDAESTIQQAFALNDPEMERHQGPLFASAILADTMGNSDLAIERYTETMTTLREDFERVFNSDIEPNWAQAFGLHTNYFESALALSFLYKAKEDYDKQMEMLDIAIEGSPTNADLFVWRGQAKLAKGDNEGAIADFNEALRFIPDDAEALAGLEEAGGAPANADTDTTTDAEAGGTVNE
ncbi:MAG: hypothetical protein FWE46_02285 [Coriobacteriia bacterium]|nr:hypothetical protein [Coriobacteriia bacterium]MCL2537261.1 hypothetical protein [Coriobacteriia bacterium]